MTIKNPMNLPLPTGPKPEVGQEIYIRDSWSIDRGEDDVCGGKAVISELSVLISAGKSTWFVAVKEVSGTSYNYSILFEEQESLKNQYKDAVAHRCPDYG